MKITIKLPKPLVLEAKRYAKKEKKTYREVVEMALGIYIKKEKRNLKSPKTATSAA